MKSFFTVLYFCLFCLTPFLSIGQIDGGGKNFQPRVVMTNSLDSGGIQFRSFTTNATSASTALVIDMPAGIVSGDCLTLFIATDSDSFLNALDTGWTVRETNSLASAGFWVVQKVSDGTEGVTETFGFAANENAAAICVAHKNSNPTTPFDGDVIGTGVAPNHITPAITPSVNSSMLLGCIFIDPVGDVVYTEVPGYTLLATCNRGANGSLAVAQRLQTTATAEGVEITSNSGATFGEYTTSIKP